MAAPQNVMKIILILTALICGLTDAVAQGTLQFDVNLSGANEVPPNGITATATGTFDLAGNSLDYYLSGVRGPYVYSEGSINGPADMNSSGPVLFDLGPIKPTDPILDPGGPYVLAGTVNNLSTGQIDDLLAGLWYVNVYSPSYSDQQIRGQILLVPEPATWSLLISGAATLAWWRRRKGLGFR